MNEHCTIERVRNAYLNAKCTGYPSIRPEVYVRHVGFLLKEIERLTSQGEDRGTLRD